MQILASLDLRIAEDGDLVVDLLPAGLIVCLMLFQTGVNEKLRKRGSNLVQCGIGACAQGFVNRRWELRGHLIQSLVKRPGSERPLNTSNDTDCFIFECPSLGFDRPELWKGNLSTAHRPLEGIPSNACDLGHCASRPCRPHECATSARRNLPAQG